MSKTSHWREFALRLSLARRCWLHWVVLGTHHCLALFYISFVFHLVGDEMHREFAAMLTCNV